MRFWVKDVMLKLDWPKPILCLCGQTLWPAVPASWAECSSTSSTSACTVRVPLLWKTFCLVPFAGYCAEQAKYRPIALTSHILKVMQRLVLAHVSQLLCSSQDTLKFVQQPYVGVDEAIICRLQKAHSELDRPNTAVHITFFDFSSIFNTIQPRLLKAKLEKMWVDYPDCTDQQLPDRQTTICKITALCVWTSDL